MTIRNHVKNPQDGRYSSRYLSRKRVVNWDEAAYTVLTSARDVASSRKIERRGDDIHTQL